MTKEQLEWIAAAKRLMRATGPHSGWHETADRGDKLFANDAALSEAKEAMERAKKVPMWDTMPYALHKELDAVFAALNRAAAAPPSCRDALPGTGYCDQCAAGRYEHCRYVVPVAVQN